MIQTPFKNVVGTFLLMSLESVLKLTVIRNQWGIQVTFLTYYRFRENRYYKT